MKKYSLLWLLLLIASCEVSQTANKKKADAAFVRNNGTSQTTLLPSVNCDSILIELVKSSSISNELKKYKIKSNGLDDSTLYIEIYNVNDMNYDVGLANLALDINKKRLFDETIDPDSPKILTCDTTLLNYMVHHCINWLDVN